MNESSPHAWPQTASRKGQSPGTGKSQRATRALAACCLLLAILLPLASVYGLANRWPNALLAVLGNANLPHREATLAAAGSASLWVAAIVGMLPVALMSYALVIAYRIFSGFTAGDYFNRGVVDSLRRFAAAMFVAALACVLVPPLVGLIVTAGGSGPMSLSLSFGSQHLVLLLFAAVVWQMARVMAEAVAIAEENAQIV
ncbi:MAG: DUF2975 domain-containing protein [Burkholderiales bacterium]|nr:MAG: DUF2975 domain-containing protein [Betaproteobacteria bacterium]TAG72292.1 MAG: DUF2975 domain-containing protein [Burkholderiales bacterium]